MSTARELARTVQEARRRAYWCARHNQKQAPHCIDCHLERLFQWQIRSIDSIMRPLTTPELIAKVSA